MKIDELAAKLAASLAREGKLQAKLDQISEENKTMFSQVVSLNKILEKQDGEHKAGVLRAEKMAFKMGHASVVKEVAKLWTSKEYAAELMFGEFIWQLNLNF